MLIITDEISGAGSVMASFIEINHFKNSRLALSRSEQSHVILNILIPFFEVDNIETTRFVNLFPLLGNNCWF